MKRGKIGDCIIRNLYDTITWIKLYNVYFGNEENNNMSTIKVVKSYQSVEVSCQQSSLSLQVQGHRKRTVTCNSLCPRNQPTFVAIQSHGPKMVPDCHQGHNLSYFLDNVRIILAPET